MRTGEKFEKIGNTDIDLSNYVKKDELPTKVSSFENDVGYLTEHQSLDNYALKSEIPTSLKNPNALTVKIGEETNTYDGSEAITVEIPESTSNNSLNITGATVGQTVKIASVDDNGVPTAWAPVDMPSGGKTEVTDETLENAKATGGIGWEDTEIHKIDEKYLPEHSIAGTTAEVMPTQIKTAVDAGQAIALAHTDETYGTLTFSSFDVVSTAAGYTVHGETAYGTGSDAFMLFSLTGDVTADTWTFSARSVPTMESIPSGGDVTNIITYPVSENYDINDAYKYVSYTQASLNTDGTLNESVFAKTTEFLPVVAGETLFLNSGLTGKVAFYNANKEFISLLTVASEQTVYIVPDNAVLARFQNQYNGGEIHYFQCRERPQEGITTLKDLIFSPLHSTVDLLVTGDSNTYSYGLSDRENEGWAYLFAKMLATITEIHVGYMSPYAHAVGYHNYGVTNNFRAGSRLAIYTDAQSVTLAYDKQYSATWKWYVNDVEQEETSTVISGLDNTVKKVEVRFTGGQTILPMLTVSKTINVTNAASKGGTTVNCSVPSGHDWLLLMIGTNDRSATGGVVGTGITYLQYTGKGTYIVPFPNRKIDASYVASQAQVFGELASAFKSMNYEVCDASDFGYAFMQDDTLYQTDMIHYSAKGHKAIANIVGGKLGFPVTAM